MSGDRCHQTARIVRRTTADLAKKSPQDTLTSNRIKSCSGKEPEVTIYKLK